MAKPPSSIPENPENAPESLPIGVRAPAKRTEPGIGGPPAILRGWPALSSADRLYWADEAHKALHYRRVTCCHGRHSAGDSGRGDRGGDSGAADARDLPGRLCAQ